MNFQTWTHHFSTNGENFSHISFSLEPELSEAERRLITPSIQQFQHGENSEGLHLKKHAKRWNADYFDTITYFIREEQGHSAILGKFMSQEHIPQITGHWLDSIFRRIRNIGGLECSLMVLSSAEIMATTYYKALRDATASQSLKAICDQILRDEEIHINFQAFTLGAIQEKRGWLMRKLMRYVHTLFVAGTACVVWMQYRKVYQCGGYRFRKFFRETMKEYNRMDSMIEHSNEIIWLSPAG